MQYCSQDKAFTQVETLIIAQYSNSVEENYDDEESEEEGEEDEES